jgi:hypothetical protein
MPKPTDVLMSLADHYYAQQPLRPKPAPVPLIIKALNHSDEDTRLAGMYALDDYVQLGGDIKVIEQAVEGRWTGLARESIVLYRSVVVDKTESRTLTPDPRLWVPAQSQPPTERILVIHGTWPKGNWWLPGSAFVMYLDSVTKNAVYKQTDQFQWSGANSHAVRLQAGELLATWLGFHPNIDTIVAHSHGGSVVFIATGWLIATWRKAPAPTKLRRIKKVINLGTPARTDYPPDLRVVRLLRNVYSFGDLVQTPIGSAPHPRGEGRSVSDSFKALNVKVDSPTGGWPPGHSDLHSEAVWRHNELSQYL